jgi:hypothetical protein
MRERTIAKQSALPIELAQVNGCIPKASSAQLDVVCFRAQGPCRWVRRAAGVRQAHCCKNIA